MNSKFKKNSNRLFAHDVTAVARNAAGGQEVIFSIGISSRNSRCLGFALFMNSQIGQTEKTQGDFIVYEHVLFIRGEKSRNWLKNEEKSGL